MTFNELVAKFKKQFEEEIDKYTAMEQDPAAAFGSGALLVVTALIRFDGAPKLDMQLRAMHEALRKIGTERNWTVVK